MKSLSKFFVLAFIASFFVSCGGDDPVDYTVKDLSPLSAAAFNGSVVCHPIDLKRDDVTSTTASVRLVPTSKANVLGLETSESGLVSDQGDILTNFKRTSDDSSYTFDIKGFKFARTSPVPVYIQQWLGADYDTNGITSVEVTVSPTSATYVKASRTLTFSYKANVSVQGKVNGINKPTTFQMEFRYNVKQ